jgi:hypothetical protein
MWSQILGHLKYIFLYSIIGYVNYQLNFFTYSCISNVVKYNDSVHCFKLKKIQKHKKFNRCQQKSKLFFFKLKITTTDKNNKSKAIIVCKKNEPVIKYKKPLLVRNSIDIKHYLFSSFKKCARYI